MKLRIREVGRLKKNLQGILLPFLSNKVVILVYHRVYEATSDPQLLCVTPQHFAEHLEYLRNHYRIISLSELISALREKRLPKRAVIITFDDGYVDNLLNAKPSLEQYEAPATVFVTTGCMGREFWWDELERLTLWAPQLPECLQVTINGRIYEWRLGKWAELPEEGKMPYAQWHVEIPDNPTPRHQAYRELYKLLRSLEKEKQERVLAQLRELSKDKGNMQRDCRAMTPEEICQLADGGLVEIGAHTVTHPVLSALPASAQWDEIQQTKADLEEILGRPVTSFAYPYGSRSDYTQETVAIVREIGFACACSNFAKVVWQDSDLYELPRFLVRDWHDEEFAYRLETWFRG